MFLLEASLHDELVATVNGPAGPQLGKEEGEQMLRLSVEHLGDFSKVGERGLLGSNAHHLKTVLRIRFILLWLRFGSGSSDPFRGKTDPT